MFWLAVLIALMLSGAMALAWRVALTTGQSGRIDAIWAFATGLAAVVAAAASAGRPAAADLGLRDGRDLVAPARALPLAARDQRRR